MPPRDKNYWKQWAKTPKGVESRRRASKKWLENGGAYVMNKTRRIKKYGISAEEHDKLFKNPICEICGRTAGRMSLDHDHKTGQIRGVLCGACNRGIGLLGDDADIVEKALDYLRKFCYNLL